MANLFFGDKLYHTQKTCVKNRHSAQYRRRKCHVSILCGNQITSMKRILKLFSTAFNYFNLLCSFITSGHLTYGVRLLLALSVTNNVRIWGSYMFFHALTFAGSQGSCLNMRPLGRMFKLLPKDPANVNALKQTCLIVILAFYMIP